MNSQFANREFELYGKENQWNATTGYCGFAKENNFSGEGHAQ